MKPSGLPRFLVIASLLAGCGPLRYTVDDGLFRDMAIDKKVRLFDAENDVSIALDDKEQMHERVHDLGLEVQAASHERDARRGEGHGPRERDMWQRRVTFLEMSIDYVRARMHVQDTVIAVARAKFELAKALVVKKNQLSGASGITIRDFEQQLARLEDRFRDESAKLARQKPRLERARGEWLKLRDDIASASIGGIGAPGGDEIAVWEAW